MSVFDFFGKFEKIIVGIKNNSLIKINVDKSVKNLITKTANPSKENMNFTVKLFFTTPNRFLHADYPYN